MAVRYVSNVVDPLRLSPRLAVLALSATFLGATGQGRGPTFKAPMPEVVELARSSWDAAVQCAGWEAPALDEVAISFRGVRHGFGGSARIGERGLESIALVRDDDETFEQTLQPLPHEVAHAWSTAGDTILTEGDAELLARCIRDRVGLSPTNRIPPKFNEHTPDPRTFDAAEQLAPEVMREGYRQAIALAQVRGALKGHRALWSADRPRLVVDELAELRTRGEPGDLVAQLFTSLEARRKGLADPDEDGLPTAAELLLGTNPDRADSDGDGWIDGESPRAGALALPWKDKQLAVCRAPDDRELRFSQNLSKPTRRKQRDGGDRTGSFHVLSLGGRSPFFAWVHDAAALSTESCIQRPTFGLAGGTSDQRSELARSLEALDAQLPVGLTPVAAFELGTSNSGWTDGRIELGDALLAESPQTLAAYARAMSIAAQAGPAHRNLDTAEVVAQALLGGRELPLLAPFPEDVVALREELTGEDGSLEIPGLPAIPVLDR